ncbi:MULTISPECIES: RICIN domain-containing protein [unclassified Streptomyces]|uniref:RICIN domain-containing protein n=1 Tax=unclassified Streptomyces TaxID=2593676 RepID=UPI000DB0079A|nr:MULTISPECIES: RICIN domain-containing protein [unclassified Streptomyces]PZT73768.1 hypothetical protein DNK55_16205 [Streptomyces sp. AC1-42T]PZT83237.1 hypothetical protein DNK56_15220 [Streptomyces sp. AC1-42W]
MKAALAMAVGVTALAAVPASAVTFPDDGTAFRIQLRDDPSLCLAIESRSTGQKTGKLLVTRPCDEQATAQRFTYQADRGYIHNASVPDDQCLTGFPAGLRTGFGMGPCSFRPNHPLLPRKFVATPDPHLFVTSTPKSGEKPLSGCVATGREGTPAVLQGCTDGEWLDFELVPAKQ